MATLDDLWTDLRLAWRGLRRSLRFTATAVLVLGIGIAGATAIVALVRGVLVRPLPVRDERQLIIAWKDLKASGYQHYPFGDRPITAVAARTRRLASVAGVTSNGVSHWIAVDDRVAASVNGALVTGSFFDVLDVAPLLGRRLAPSDDVDTSEPVVVISAGLWRRRYGGARDVIGRRLTLDERPFTIVGVMPPDLDYPHGVELWRTTRSVPTSQTFGDAARQEVDLIARLRNGVTIEQAADELSTLTRQLEAEAPPSAARGLTPVVRPFGEAIVGNARLTLVAFLAAVGLVLFIASANVANLLLMRGEGRRSELAVRLALGARQSRLVRQLLTESVLLSMLAAALAITTAALGLRAFIALVPDGLPRVEAVRVDGLVVAIVVAVTIVTTLVTALGPALLAVRIDLTPALRSAARGVGARGATRVRRTLVLAQVALAVTVMSGSGLLVRTVLHLQSTDLGIAADRLAVVFLEMPKTRYTDRTRHAQFLAGVVASLESTPGITAATPVNIEPFGGGWGVPSFAAEGQGDERARSNPALGLEAVHENYFRTLGIPIVRGRAFTADDRHGALAVAILSADLAARVWPGENPIGKRLKWGSTQSNDPWLTIVGIAAPVRYQDLAAPKPTIYVPAVQFIVAAQRLVVRATTPLSTTTALVRDRVAALDPDIRVMRVAPFAEMLDAPLARPRFNALLLGIFAGVALLLSAVGHYAVTAAHVRQREREIAVRLALGATPWTVGRMVVAEAAWLGIGGALVGLGGAFAVTRLLRGLLFGIEPLDPISLAGAALLLVAATAVVSCGPVRRAARVDVGSVLRV